MILKKLSIAVSLLMAVSISGCSSMGDSFPDKEKDYQFSSEIPPLILPESLSDHAVIKETKTDIPPSITQNDEITELTEINEKSEDTVKNEKITVVLDRYSDGVALIRMGEITDRSWRIIGKALSHQSIEITKRDELDKIYYVQYDPDFKKVEDGSLWDEILFIFGSDPANDKRFGVKLVDNGINTEIIILDYENKTVTDGAGLKLLHLLYRTIKKDLEKNIFKS